MSLPWLFGTYFALYDQYVMAAGFDKDVSVNPRLWQIGNINILPVSAINLPQGAKIVQEGAFACLH